MVRSHTLSTSLSFVIFSALQWIPVFSAATAGPGTTLFARQNPNCIQNCPTPSCNCSSNEVCVYSAQSCTQCSEASCTSSSSSSSSSSGSANAPIGAIVGGTLGGVFVACLIAYFLYRKYGKKNQARMSMAASAAEKENDFGMLKSARASTHTVASIASTVRTRASNVIQIAYIPGVTNRSTPSTPGHLVPPVPPLPFQDGTAGSQYQQSIQFSAEDILRQSMYTINDNRSSVATTIYGQNAVVAQPVAANVVRAGKAAVVTVKGGPGANGGSPPTLFAPKGSVARVRSPLAESHNVDDVPPSPAFSVGSTFLNRMNSTKKTNSEAATTAPNSPRRLTPSREKAGNENQSTFSYDSSESEDDIVPGQRSKRRQSACSCITDMDTGSPFSDHNSVTIDDIPPVSAVTATTAHVRRVSLNAATGLKSVRMIPTERTASPFDDSNSIDKVAR
ncbi:hypothetical protein RUND412_002660 [Rhizina undulata]